MIEQGLKDTFHKIFDLKRTTFNAQSDSQEQECLFIEIDQIQSDVKDNILTAKVAGKCTVYAQTEKMPPTYFLEKISAAANELTKDLFFHDFQSQPMEVNIVKRTFSFIYFFASQYNPDAANIESIEITGLP